jgi:hypothetical protein
LGEAEALLWPAADAADTEALKYLAVLQKRQGDQEGAEASARQALDAGANDANDALAEAVLSLWPYGLDPNGAPAVPWP